MSSESEIGGYVVTGRLAVGGMAEIWRARPGPEADPSPDEPGEVVLKRLLPTFRSEPSFVEHFLQEGRLCARLLHPSVVRTFRALKRDDDYLMVQELVVGHSLATVVRRLHGRNAALPPPEAVSVAVGLLRGLAYVHGVRYREGQPATVVHCDVNPANVLVARDGRVKLSDFGVALPDGALAAPGGALRGTIAYMAPEQILGKPVDRRTDLFAAGIVLWELLANRPYVEAASEYEAMSRARQARVPVLSTLRDDLPDLLSRVVRKAVFADPALRFHTAEQMGAALEAVARREGWSLEPTTLAVEASS